MRDNERPRDRPCAPDERPTQRTTTRSAGLSAERPIPVVWNQRLRRPTAFIWRRRRYRVERVVRTWVVETGWWDDSIRVSRRYCRVRADGRLFDIYFDRLTRNWFLDKTLG